MDNKSVYKLIADPFEEIAYHEGAVLTGINFKVKPSTVLMMVKARFKDGRNGIVFIECEAFMDCWEFLAEGLYTTSIKLQWREDRYASK